jgi:hypothetical protein
MSCAATIYGARPETHSGLDPVPHGRAAGAYIRSMNECTVRPAVFEIQKADYSAFTRKPRDEIGRDLSGCSQVRAVWLAAEDAGTRYEKRYLQVAVSADGSDLDDVAVGLLQSLERRHRVRLALARWGGEV